MTSLLKRIIRLLKLFEGTLLIALSCGAAALVTFVTPQSMLRPAVLCWFLFICPGFVVMRFFHLQEAVLEWALILALSITIDAFVVGAIMYAGLWSPALILSVLIVLCMSGAIAHGVLVARISLRVQSLADDASPSVEQDQEAGKRRRRSWTREEKNWGRRSWTRNVKKRRRRSWTRKRSWRNRQ